MALLCTIVICSFHTLPRDLVELLRENDRNNCPLVAQYRVTVRVTDKRIEQDRTAFPGARIVVKDERVGVVAMQDEHRFIWEGSRRQFHNGTEAFDIVERISRNGVMHSYNPSSASACIIASRPFHEVTPLTLIGTRRGSLGAVTVGSDIRIHKISNTGSGYIILTMYDRGRRVPWGRVWLDPRIGSQPVRHEYYDNGGNIWLRIEDVQYERNNQITCELKWLPVSATIRAYEQLAYIGMQESRIAHLDVVRWDVCDSNSDVLFNPAFPKGTIVWDAGLGITYVGDERAHQLFVERRKHIENMLESETIKHKWLRNIVANEMSDRRTKLRMRSVNTGGSLEPIEVHPLRSAVFVVGILGAIAVLASDVMKAVRQKHR